MAVRTATGKDERVDLVRKELEDAGHWHPDYCEKVDDWYRCWRGVLESRSKAAQWRWRLHPPYAMQVADTIMANVLDSEFKFKAVARARQESDLQMLEMRSQAARLHETLMNDQLDRERFIDKLDPHDLQVIIAGMSVMKQSWRRDVKTVRRIETVRNPVPDPWQGVRMVEAQQEVEQEHVLYEGPFSEVVDVRDFWWYPEGAVSIDRATSVCHRVFYTMDELRRLEAQGVYSNIDGLSDTKDYSGEIAYREQGLFNTNRAKGMVEVIERWTRDRVICVANRKVVVRDERNPFWHGEVPFVVTNTRPDLFRIPGVSEIEIIRDLQTALWSMMNQRLENTELNNLAIVMFRSDFDDPDSFEFAPGARNIVDDPSQVQMWTPNPLSSQISIPAEQSIRADIQNISGGAPFMSGSDSMGMDQTTATGVSIVTSLAQRLLERKKQRFINSLDRIFDQRAWLNRQFMTEPMLLKEIGPDGIEAYVTVSQQDLSPDCYFQSEPASETMMVQQRRAESQARMQTALQIAPVLAAIAQGNPEAKTLNVELMVEDWLRDWGVDNVQRYFSVKPQPAVAQAPGGPPQPGQEPQPEGPPQGATASTATDQLSPSNADTMSPVAAMQRMMAQTGPLQ